MTRRVAVAVAALVLPGSAAAGISVTGVDTSGYPEVRVTVVAPPGSERPRLTENGLVPAGLRTANLGRAKSVVIAVDRSMSMRGASLADATAAARSFVAAKGAADRIEVVAFGHQALALTRFSSSAADADAALRQLAVDRVSGTALWDAVALAARRLAKDDRPGHAIVVVTDGSDVSSTASFDEAVAAAQRARAAVYTIGIVSPDFAPSPLRTLAARTGGAYLQTTSTSELASLYSSIGRVLARTWQLRYPTAARPGDRIRLVASVPFAGSGGRTVTVAGDGAAAATPAPASELLPSSLLRSHFGPLLVAVAVGLLVLLALGALGAARSGLWLSARLAHHVGPAEQKQRRRRDRRASLRSFLAATERSFGRVKQFRALQRLLARADLPLLAAEVAYISVGSGLVLGFFAVVTRMPVLLVAAFFVLGALIPLGFVVLKARARIKRFDSQLPDLLITIAASLKAGHSFRHAIQAVVDEGAEPAATEFRRVLTETRLGRPMDEALVEVADRIGSKDFSFVLTAVAVQRQIGGSLAGLFDIVAEIVRQRQQFARKIRGLTAMGRMSAYVLAGLPFVVAIAISLLNPTYMAPLWNTQTGHTMVGLGLGMLVVGAAILKKIVSFKG